VTEPRRVVATGLGIASSIGMDIDSFWGSLENGETGIKPLTVLDTSEHKTKYGGEIDSAAISDALKVLNFRPDDRAVSLAQIASAQALEEVGLFKPGTAPEPSDTATLFGTGAGASGALFTTYKGYNEKGLRGIRPTTVPRCMANAVTAQLSMKFRLTGTNYVTVCACAASTTAIGLAFRMIRDGYSNRVLCGGTDSLFDPVAFGSWNNLGVMSKDPNPKTACKPFDLNRDGCVLGEGAAAIVLEDMDSAIARGAQIHAEIIGYGESSDALHITSPNVDGQAKAIRLALESADISAEDVALINAHGTATKANDSTESASIRKVFGAAADNIPVVSNKSYIGHLLGASGAAELVASILMLKHGKIVPNLNLTQPDPECNLNLPTGSAIDLNGNIVVKNSFGFGGHNSVLVIKGVEK
jgi:3-oxoacyl-[acyl-carrier-protein] synthase II